MRTVYTLGHSSRTLEEFLDLLKKNAIKQLADVRRFPGSRRNPHFGREALAQALAGQGIDYRHEVALGGRRRGVPDSPHTAWEVAGFRHYADHMETAEFQNALREFETWATVERTTILCAEASPFSCHRRLIADALLRDGFEVLHILDATRLAEHKMTPFARLDGERLVYDGGTLPLD